MRDQQPDELDPTNDPTVTLGEIYLRDVRNRFQGIKKLGDRAIAQVSDEELFQVLDAESNSIAMILKHLTGNMRSRWTDFLTTDGEKPDRNRDSEFVIEGEDRRGISDAWDAAWVSFLETLSLIRPEELTRKVTIRHEPFSVVAAINRQLEHYGYHVGQIVFLAKHFKSSAWQTLSIARASSSAFNQQMREKYENESQQ
jgi:hypothetical protein